MQSFVLVFLFISTYAHIATHPIYNSFFFFFNKPISLKTKQNKKSTILPKHFQKGGGKLHLLREKYILRATTYLAAK